ncbi:MAG: nicotinate phosphoribosyltransferase [Thermoleophilia bacterium]|nr:nicotinate phosphoribosyltransferase [Thermoleophilia bacterium]
MTAAARPEPPGALLVDLYQLTMAQSYVAEGLHELPATFSLFARSVPPGWGYLVAAGLDDALAYLEALSFRPDELAFLEETRLFTGAFLAELERLSFTGSVRALPEGTAFFAPEPVLEVTAPMLEAQLVETVVLNTIHYQSLVAAKAARCVDAAGGRGLVDFGLRRTHGADAGLRAARASYLAGFEATSNVLAGRLYGIPTAGTMAHSYVESFPDELAAFRAYARAYPDRAILLVDTYDTVAGARRAAIVGRELAERGHRLRGVRLDSGDLGALARRVRAILDQAGLEDATVFASGGLDERDVGRLLAEGASIDAFGIGSKLGTVADCPFLDMAYKLVELGGRGVLKLSGAKATLPGAKQAWRLAAAGEVALDVLGLELEEPPEGGEPLLVAVMERGKRTWHESLERARARCAGERARLPASARALDAAPCEVELSVPLLALRDRVAADARRAHGLA